jgi:hypothetical protein
VAIGFFVIKFDKLNKMIYVNKAPPKEYRDGVRCQEKVKNLKVQEISFAL